MVAAEKQPIIDDQKQRNAVVAEGFCAAVGKIDQGQRRFGLGQIRDKIAVTQSLTIALNVLAIKLEKLLVASFCLLDDLAMPLPGQRKWSEYSHYAAEALDS